MDRLSEALGFEFSGIVPVFPLPDTVFFPHTVLPLHIFEDRYRAMVADAMQGEQLIGMALLKPGWEKGDRRNPPFFPVGTVGRLTAVERLDGGRYNLNLVGIAKVSYREVVSETPYRRARADLLEETEPDLSEDALEEWRRRLTSVAMALMVELFGTPEVSLAKVRDQLSFAATVNLIASLIPASTDTRRHLLELPTLAERARQVESFLDQRFKQALFLKEREGLSPPTVH